jgi:DNA-binding LytR/AlgR family response regulator
MRIAIVDDERPARSELRHQIQELLKEAEIVEGDSGAAALQLAGDGKYELFFLDINLGDISGTVLVNAIHNMQPQAKIIFVTAYSEYAVEAFELGVEDYVMKPFDQKRIQKVLDRCKVGGKEENVQHADSQSQGKQASIRRLAINSDGRLLKMWKILFTLRHITEAARFTQQKGNTAKTNLSENMKRSWIRNSFSGFTKVLL